MIRILLSLTLCGMCLGLGLESARLQSANYAKGTELDELKRRCDLIEAGNEALRYRINQRLVEIAVEARANRRDGNAGLEDPRDLEQ